MVRFRLGFQLLRQHFWWCFEWKTGIEIYKEFHSFCPKQIMIWNRLCLRLAGKFSFTIVYIFTVQHFMFLWIVWTEGDAITFHCCSTFNTLNPASWTKETQLSASLTVWSLCPVVFFMGTRCWLSKAHMEKSATSVRNFPTEPQRNSCIYIYYIICIKARIDHLEFQ